MKKLEIFQCESCDAVFHSEQECIEHEHECNKVNNFIIYKHILVFSLDECTYTYKVNKFIDAKLIDKENNIYELTEEEADEHFNTIKIIINKVETEFNTEFKPAVKFVVYTTEDINCESMLKMHLKSFLFKKNEQFSKCISEL